METTKEYGGVARVTSIDTRLVQGTCRLCSPSVGFLFLTLQLFRDASLDVGGRD